MRKLTFSLMAAAAVLTAGGAANAQAAPAQHQPLTRATAEQRADKAFDRLDANKDGKIDQADRLARQKARFDRVDGNHDGQVSFAEFTAKREQHDATRHERVAQRGERHGERFARSGTHRMAMRGHRAGGFGFTRFADADKDGAISKAEFQSAALQRFERLDANHDGTVTRDEAKAARDNMRQQWQARREAPQG